LLFKLVLVVELVEFGCALIHQRLLLNDFVDGVGVETNGLHFKILLVELN
jgi:hypothetical protein